MSKQHETTNQQDKRHQIKLLSLKNERKAERLNVIEESKKVKIVNLLVKDARVQSLARNRIMRKLTTRLQELTSIRATDMKTYRTTPRLLPPVHKKKARLRDNHITEQSLKNSLQKDNQHVEKLCSQKRSVQFQLPVISQAGVKHEVSNKSDTKKKSQPATEHNGENGFAKTKALPCLPVL